MATTTQIDQQRQEWLAQRQKGIGSSDAASLFPESTKYGCARRLVLEKRGVPPDFERTQSEKDLLEKGKALEAQVAAKFSRDYGLKVRRIRKDNGILVDRDDSTRRVSPDYLIVGADTDLLKVLWPTLELEGVCGPGILECKVTNLFDYARMMKEGIIPDYVFQLERLLDVSGYRWGVFATLEPDFWKMLAFPFTPNRGLIEEMTRRADELWELVANPSLPLPPALPSGDERCPTCLWRKTCFGDQYVKLVKQRAAEYTPDDSFAEVITDLKQIRDQKSAFEETEGNIKKACQEQMTAKGLVKIQIPSVGAKVRWQDQDGALSWDTHALEAEAGTIGRKVAFADWVQEKQPGLVIDFQKEQPKSPSLEEKFKYRKAPTRPFVVTFD